MLTLNGTWRATPANESLRRNYVEPDFDGDGWVEVPVPGHWQEAPSLTYADGPVLYRTEFDSPAVTSAQASSAQASSEQASSEQASSERSWLRLDGIFYQSDVWLDGDYLGDTEGYFFPHLFEITSALREREQHVLAVEAACSRVSDLTAKRNLTGIFQHWDSANPNINPGGIWRPVGIETSGSVFIKKFRVLCNEATEGRGRLAVRVVVDSSEAHTALLRTQVRREGTSEVIAEHTEVRPLATGDNRLKWNVYIEEPELWWPHALGQQPLYDVTFDVVVGDVDSAPSHSRSLKTGIRDVRMDDWRFRINGERIFLKGTNLGPTHMRLGSVTPEAITADVQAVRDANLDLARVHGHINRPELYEAADRLGVLLWQDLPLQWGYARSVRKAAAHQAREAVDLLGHHPSIITWCGHNQPMALDVTPDTNRLSGRFKVRKVALQQLPTWNRTVLGTTLKRALGDADPSRPVNSSAGTMPNLASPGADTQLFSGWESPHLGDFTRLIARFPRVARFVSAFGAQAVPSSDEFINTAKWPNIDFDQLTYLHAYQPEVFGLHAAPSNYDSYEAWKRATQEYQAKLIKHHVEALRRLKYRPTGGFTHYLFADADPTTSFAVLDHQRQAKLGHGALVDACRPVLVTAEWPAESYAPGAPISLAVHVVSDLRHAIGDVDVTARLTGGPESLDWQWSGAVDADSCSHVGTIQTVAPRVAGPLTLSLELRSPDVQASNQYEVTIASDTHGG